LLLRSKRRRSLKFESLIRTTARNFVLFAASSSLLRFANESVAAKASKRSFLFAAFRFRCYAAKKQRENEVLRRSAAKESQRFKPKARSQRPGAKGKKEERKKEEQKVVKFFYQIIFIFFIFYIDKKKFFDKL
jgi:hypothetical protein